MLSHKQSRYLVPWYFKVPSYLIARTKVLYLPVFVTIALTASSKYLIHVKYGTLIYLSLGNVITSMMYLKYSYLNGAIF